MVQEKELTTEDVVEIEASETTSTRLPGAKVAGKHAYVVKRAFVVAATDNADAVAQIEQALQSLAIMAAELRAQEEAAVVRELEAYRPLFGSSNRGPSLPS